MMPGVGIFGTGKVIYALVPMLRKQGFEVKAIWGRTAEESQSASKALGIPFWTAKMDEIVLHKEVNVIFVVCPPQYQSQILIKALGIGKHVVCNPPGGLVQADVVKTVQASQYYPTLITVMSYGLRLLPVFGVTKQLIQGGFCGQVQLCDVRVDTGPVHADTYDWTCDGAMGGGVLSCIGAHVVDAVLFLTGQEPHLVNGLLKYLDNAVMNGFRRVNSDTFCSFQMELTGNVSVNATLGVRSTRKTDFNLELFVSGTRGALKIRDSELYGKKWDSDEEELLFSDDGSVPANVDEPWPILRGLLKLVESLRAAFVGAEEGNIKWNKDAIAGAASFEDGQHVVAVMEAIKRSSMNKQWTPVYFLKEPDEPELSKADGHPAPFYVSL
ncbi:unnamed protein product [Notodromas monacha]|uniref:Glucose-fructose oxidoreductase domain-containing protein 1 n=1 Tax=Notodromas monacha TaxID=399045 RepID=A0A7R9BG14_9CRUS|nr:unnamed protein product [Notodromas monacha]CAG0914788.1 unnamed protein product [Notodromas monacha]